MSLRYLDFDYSEDTEDIGVFEAMATTGPQQAAAVHAEIIEALPGRRGPVGDGGGEWDYDLQAMQELTVPQTLEYDEARGRLEVRTGPACTPRHTVTLTISGTPAFCAAFRDRFGLG